MQTTANYGLKKPEGSDVVDVQNFNDNADTIDAELKKRALTVDIPTSLPADGGNSATATKLATARKINGASFDGSKDITILADSKFETAGGTATVITLTIPNLVDGVSKTFIASASNNGAATTINGKSLYKPNTTTAPTIIAGKAYTVWYNASSSCFFIKASAEGNAIAAHVLAGDTFSNDTDIGLIGTATIVKLVAGDKYSLYSNTTLHSTTLYDTTIFVDKITIQFNCDIRISFNLSSGANDHAQGQIYKNRQPIGVARDVSSRDYRTFSEDFECKNGDVFELCLVAPSEDDRVYSTYFEVLCDISSNPILSS